MRPPLGKESESSPALLARSVDIHGSGNDNFPKGCAFSPDGLCVLTATAHDNRLRLYNTPPLPSDSQEVGDSEGEESARAGSAAAGGNEKEGGSGEASCADDGPSGLGEKSTAASPPSSSLAPWSAALSTCPSGGTCDAVRSYAWYPLMNSSVPSTCTFLAAVRGAGPIHLVDAYDGTIRASYRPYNGLDEVESPGVAAFSPDGERVFAAGFRTDRTVQVFRTERPGRESDVLRLGRTRRSKDGQKGLISALAFPPLVSAAAHPSVFAIGTYSPGSIYVYDDRTAGGVVGGGDPAGTVMHGGVCVVGHGRAFARKKRRFAEVSPERKGAGGGRTSGNGTDGSGDNNTSDLFSAAKSKWYHSRARTGVTQLTWCPSGEYTLYSASRRSDAVIAWDLRALSGDASHGPVRGVASYPRAGDTNQRLEFDLDPGGKRLFACSADGTVKIYDVKSRTLEACIDGFDDVPNGVSYLSTGRWGRDGGLLAVATGARRFAENYDDNEDDDSECGGNALQKQDLRPPGSLEVYAL